MELDAQIGGQERRLNLSVSSFPVAANDDRSNSGLFSKPKVFKEIKAKDLPVLQAQLNLMAKDTHDPFAQSAAYFGMTGRNGLWIYGNDTGFVLMARHPNDENAVLVFPPYGDATTNTVKEAMSHRRFPEGNVELARANPSNKTQYREQLTSGKIPHDFQTKLDWAQPVHLVSALEIVERDGPEFRQLRQNFNKAVREKLSAQEISTKEHIEDVKEIVRRWAEQDDKPGYSREDLMTPTESLLQLMKREIPVSISGVVVHDAEKQPIGFWIWHETEDKVAMSLARVSIGHLDGIKGSAEFGAVKMAEILKARGATEICLGGSETESLDAFKQKLNPYRSMRLSSLSIRRHDQ